MIRNSNVFVAAALLAAALPATLATAGVTNPFTEDFNSGNANWTDGFNAASTWSPDGGPDGAGDGYVSSGFNFANSFEGDQTLLFRGSSMNNASGGAFIGDWLASGVTEFSFSIRHDFVAPLFFFTRFATPMNFPAAVGLDFTPVFPNTWTEITIPISESNPLIILEGGPGTFDAVFGNVGNIQFGLEVPADLAGVDMDVTFDLDKVSMLPAPGAMPLLAMGFLAGRRRRRRN